MNPFDETIIDIWVMILTGLIAALLIQRSASQHRQMTPEEYDEWLVYGKDNEPDETLGEDFDADQEA